MISVFKIALPLFLAVLMVSCETIHSNDMTADTRREIVPPALSFVTSVAPGLTQLLNQEYEESIVDFAGSIGLFAAGLGLVYSKQNAPTDDPILGLGALCVLVGTGWYVEQYFDGIFSSFIYQDQYNRATAELNFRQAIKKVVAGMSAATVTKIIGSPVKRYAANTIPAETSGMKIRVLPVANFVDFFVQGTTALYILYDKDYLVTELRVSDSENVSAGWAATAGMVAISK